MTTRPFGMTQLVEADQASEPSARHTDRSSLRSGREADGGPRLFGHTDRSSREDADGGPRLFGHTDRSSLRSGREDADGGPRLFGHTDRSSLAR